MEREFKWKADAALQDFLLLWALENGGSHATIFQMDARYFDTSDGALAKRKIGLRLRQENGACKCCLKVRGQAQDGLHSHEEYEYDTDDLHEGLHGLLSFGAPPALISELSALPLVETCRVNFTRYAILIAGGDAVAELALDRGTFSHGENSAPFCEIELEYKKGADADFLALGERLAQKFVLMPEPLSKLARALAL